VLFQQNLFVFIQRDSEASGLDEPCPQGARFKPGSECSARVLAEALSKIASSNEADTQSILGNEHDFISCAVLS
jgi:hypothetical protein